MKVSIITPSFNQADFLERTIQSVISQQGNFELEYIIVDGLSTDVSVDIIKRFAAKDKRISWISEADTGQSNAINKGLHKATGDIVAFLNSDDVYLPGALQQVVEVFNQRPDKQWLYGRCRIINQHDAEVRKWITHYKNMLLRRFHFNWLLIVNFISQPATFWRRSVLTTVGYLDEADYLAMDYEYWCRMAQQYQPIVINHYLADFRVHPDNKTKKFFVDRLRVERIIAARYTNNPFINGLHWCHAAANIVLYKILP